MFVADSHHRSTCCCNFALWLFQACSTLLLLLTGRALGVEGVAKHAATFAQFLRSGLSSIPPGVKLLLHRLSWCFLQVFPGQPMHRLHEATVTAAAAGAGTPDGCLAMPFEGLLKGRRGEG